MTALDGWLVVMIFVAAAAAYLVGFKRGSAHVSAKVKAKIEELSMGLPKIATIVGGDVVMAILNANPTRNHGNLIRRLFKIVEELGEVAEAYLNVTSASNSKGKSWDDVREELVDVLIVVVDCLLTPMPDQENFPPPQILDGMTSEVGRKLAKWKNNRDTGKAATDAE